ncbi:16S rRNA (uracil(1498)-N(3))-methyltransferase [Crocosphaera sp. UHCC 0190]|uniref:16S rRNA (uracil(1498)-N(3))-methyltransferase n=1 Tax=Crocosphaera sp. UHCC 0190 TaxID=3110246 RepID=UPI002B20DE43|nr:16S rRNA (uracil(1498)-N(3))-methyltransferase [Crocosphaera sp. UHCC 0190]MEA5512113.1 16S rRNA (uracil(1498)-N(3))-methyltransferase [Crocosphaera sp. UHCC 0190]
MVYRIVIDTTQYHRGVIHLNPEQRHYLKNVLRLKDRNTFIAIDRTGNTYLAQLIGDNAQIIQSIKESTELPIPVTLMVSLPKGNGFEDIIRSCTELGVNTFIPVISERTLLKPSSHKLERWRKIATEATEQSERQIVPQIFDPASFSETLINVDKINSDCYICVTRRKANHLLTYLSNSLTAPITIATGCEGGWTEQEVNEAIAAGFVPVSLGSRILRAVTAPIVSLSLITSFVEKQSFP